MGGWTRWSLGSRQPKPFYEPPVKALHLWPTANKIRDLSFSPTIYSSDDYNKHLDTKAVNSTPWATSIFDTSLHLYLAIPRPNVVQFCYCWFRIGLWHNSLILKIASNSSPRAEALPCSTQRIWWFSDKLSYSHIQGCTDWFMKLSSPCWINNTEGRPDPDIKIHWI